MWSKDVLCLNNFFFKKETEAAVVSGVANPSSSPLLTALNIFNAVKLEKWIDCINALILTALKETKLPCNIHLWLVCFQCWCGPHRLLHRDWRHARAHQAREDSGHLRSRDPHALPEELHGADGRPVQLHPRCPPGGRRLWEYRGGGTKPLLLHPEAGAGGDRRAR